jgi:serine/threonine-protein kinase
MDLQAGQRLDDRYVLVARLGKGGQGEVWRVEDSLKPGTVRAVKLMNVTQVGTTQIERVRREAKQLVQLDHPSLVSCHGLFEDVRQEVMGLVMDYVEGESLDALVDDPRLTETHRLAALGHVAGVLAYVHQRAVVHRDIKLENMLLSHEFWADPHDPRHLKMIDFGIAASSGNPQPLTVFGQVIGTPGYMPPEVVDPDYFKAERSQPAGDVFAWGVLAWRLLMQGHPSGLKKATLNQLANVYREAHETRSDWPPGLPATGWATVVARALALDATRRPKNGLALVELLQQKAPEMASKTVPLTARTPALGQIVDPPEPLTVREGAQRPSAVPTIADQATQPSDPAAAAVGPEDPTHDAPLHLQPTVLAPQPPPFAESPPAAQSLPFAESPPAAQSPPFAESPPLPGPPPQDSSPLSSHLPSKRHLAFALAAAGASPRCYSSASSSYWSWWFAVGRCLRRTRRARRPALKSNLRWRAVPRCLSRTVRVACPVSRTVGSCSTTKPSSSFDSPTSSSRERRSKYGTRKLRSAPRSPTPAATRSVPR